MSLDRSLIRPWQFRLDAETAHHGTVEACRWLGAVPGLTMVTRQLLEVRDPRLVTEVAGLRFENPIGLAAGWDKSGRALRMLNALGYRGRNVIVGGGGIFTTEEAWRKIRLRASLVQLDTPLVDEGPSLVPRICRDLARRLERDGFRSVADAVGTADH